MKKKPRVAIVYDRVNKFGGAERVLLALKKLYPDSVLVTSVFDPKSASWVGDWEVITTFLQKMPFAKNHHEWFAPLMPLAFESLDLSTFDIVICVTSEFAKNILTTPEQLHVCYCLTPTRYLWSHTHEYAKGRLSLLRHMVFSYLRQVDYLAAQRPDEFIAISKRIKNRIHAYYGRSSLVIYPPTTLVPTKKRSKATKKYYLVVSRLVPYKRVDLAIKACMGMKRHLFIVGTGSDGMRLLSLADGSPYIHFEGKTSDTRLSNLYFGAQALICPQEEDFGLVSVEAQNHGLPVISYAQSGVAETVLDGKSGMLFTEQTVEALAIAIKQFEKRSWNGALIKRNAAKFSDLVFARAFRRTIDKLWKMKRR